MHCFHTALLTFFKKNVYYSTISPWLEKWKKQCTEVTGRSLFIVMKACFGQDQTNSWACQQRAEPCSSGSTDGCVSSAERGDLVLRVSQRMFEMLPYFFNKELLTMRMLNMLLLKMIFWERWRWEFFLGSSASAGKSHVDSALTEL